MQVAVDRPKSRAASIVGLILALGSPFVLPFFPGQAHQQIIDAKQDVAVLVFEWIVALSLLAIVLGWERLPLSSIGFRALSWRDFVAIGVVAVTMVTTLGIFTALTGSRSNGASPKQIAALPLALRIALFVTAGFCEELMFRGYAIERLTFLTGKLWVGGAAAVVLFTLGHVPRYGFSLSLAAVAIIAVFLTALYLWRRNFWACAIVHASVDCFGL